MRPATVSVTTVWTTPEEKEPKPGERCLVLLETSGRIGTMLGVWTGLGFATIQDEAAPRGYIEKGLCAYWTPDPALAVSNAAED